MVIEGTETLGTTLKLQFHCIVEQYMKGHRKERPLCLCLPFLPVPPDEFRETYRNLLRTCLLSGRSRSSGVPQTRSSICRKVLVKSSRLYFFTGDWVPSKQDKKESVSSHSLLTPTLTLDRTSRSVPLCCQIYADLEETLRRTDHEVHNEFKNRFCFP